MASSPINKLASTVALSALLALFLAGCDANSIFLKENVSLDSGALIGGVLGSAVKENQEKGLPIEVAALSGGVVGNRIGTSLDKQDRKEALNAEYEALEYTPAGKPVRWENSASGNSGSVVAEKTYDVGNKNCRQFTHKIIVKGNEQAARGTACKAQDDTWRPLT